MRRRLIKKLRLKDVLTIFIGSMIMTIALKYILDPAGLVTGGVSGLAIVIKTLGARAGINIPLWVSNVVFNVPIFLFALKTEGFRGILRTGLCWVLMSVELAVMPNWVIPTEDLLLVSIYGGILFGASTGILLSVRATSGGTDMLANSIIHYAAGKQVARGEGGAFDSFTKRFKQISYGRLIAILDGIIVVIGALVFDIERTLFAIISIFIMGKVTDLIVNRGKDARMVLIVSEKSNEIAEAVMRDMDRGVTSLHATGMYKNVDRDVLMCICSRRDIVDIKDIVSEFDKGAFFVIGNVNEVMGEGFIENWS
ncbi:MAG: YitT family protein [Lachnospiraceae bacterium]|nr:YitT family protein [Lachnospiraceae bacterium]